MKCVRCRQDRQYIERLCQSCFENDSTLSKREQEIANLYDEAPRSMALLGYSNGEEDKLVNDIVEGMDEEGNVDNTHIFELTLRGKEELMASTFGSDFKHQMKRYMANFLGNEDYFGEKVPPHPEVDSKCIFLGCGKSKYELCTHLDTRNRIKVLYELQLEDELELLKNELESEGNEDLIAEIELYLAKIMVNNRKYHLALDHLNQLKRKFSEDLATSFKISTVEMETLLEIDPSRVEYTMEQMEENWKLVEDQEIQDIGIWHVYMIAAIAKFFLHQQQNEKALEILADVAQRYNSLGDKLGMALTARMIALALLKLDRTEEADRLLAEAVRYFNELGIDHQFHRCSPLQAMIHLNRLDISAAEYVIENSISYFQSEPRFEADLIPCYAVGSQIAISMGDMERAETYGKEAVTIAKGTNDIERIMAGLTSMVVVYARQGAPQKAHNYVEEIIKLISDKINDQVTIDNIRHQLGTIIKFAGENPHF